MIAPEAYSTNITRSHRFSAGSGAENIVRAGGGGFGLSCRRRWMRLMALLGLGGAHGPDGTLLGRGSPDRTSRDSHRMSHSFANDALPEYGRGGPRKRHSTVGTFRACVRWDGTLLIAGSSEGGRRLLTCRPRALSARSPAGNGFSEGCPPSVRHRSSIGAWLGVCACGEMASCNQKLLMQRAIGRGRSL